MEAILMDMSYTYQLVKIKNYISAGYIKPKQ